MAGPDRQQRVPKQRKIYRRLTKWRTKSAGPVLDGAALERASKAACHVLFREERTERTDAGFRAAVQSSGCDAGNRISELAQSRQQQWCSQQLSKTRDSKTRSINTIFAERHRSFNARRQPYVA